MFDLVVARPETEVNNDGRVAVTTGASRGMGVSVLAPGGQVEEHSLVPLGEARLGRIGLDEWLRRSRAGA